MKRLAALLLLAACASAPAPVPSRVPSPGAAPSVAEGGPSLCELACAHMIDLGCIRPVTPGGRTCVDVFCHDDAGWDYACMQHATSCERLDMCNP